MVAAADRGRDHRCGGDAGRDDAAMKGIRRWGPGLLLVLPSDLPDRRLRVRPHRLEREGVLLGLAAGAGNLRLLDTGAYNELFPPNTDPAWTEAVKHVLLFTGAFMVGTLLVGATIALLLDKGVKGEGFFRAIYLFPLAVSFIAAGRRLALADEPRAAPTAATGLNLALRQARARLPCERVVPEPGLGRDGARAAGGLGAVGLRHGALPGGVPRRPGGAARGGAHGRGVRVARVPARRLPAPDAR